MAWLATLLFLIGAGVLWRLARGLRERPRAVQWSAFGALVFLLGWLYLTSVSRVGAQVPWDDFVFIERLPAHLAALFILGLCWHLSAHFSRTLIAILIVLVGGYGLLEISGPLLISVYGSKLDDTVSARVGADVPDAPEGTGPSGTSGPTRPSIQVIQSTGWTCGPAALAWALQIKGLPVSEKQAAFLTATTPFHGTPDRGLLRAAHRLGLQAHLQRELTYEQLMRLPRPALVTWRAAGLITHLIVLIDMDDRGVRIGDPTLGEVHYAREQFLRKWLGNAVVFE